MRRQGLTISLVIMACLLVFLLVPWCSAKKLGVPQCIQEQTNWCWAACTQATIYYYCCSYAQCNIADSARKWNNWGQGNCCDNPQSNVCNQANWMYGTNGSFQALMDSLCGVLSTGMNSTLSKATTVAEIDAGRPYEIRWQWSGGGGHFLVGYGYEANGDTVHYMNPTPGFGYQTATYNWVVSGGTHTWTHSLQLSTNPPEFCARLEYPYPWHPGYGDPAGVCSGGSMYFFFSVNNNTGGSVGGTLVFTGYRDYYCQPYNIMVEIPRYKSYQPGFTTDHYYFAIPRFVSPGEYSISISGELSGHTVFDCLDVNILQCVPWKTTGNTEWNLVQVDRPEVSVPTVTSLGQNYPNPFNATTHLRYNLAEAGNVTLRVYDITGRLVETLIDGYQEPGEHTVVWEASDISSGVYFYKLTAGDHVFTMKMNLLK